MGKIEREPNWLDKLAEDTTIDSTQSINSIYDRGISGIVEERTSTMSEFLSKLAEDTETTQMTDTVPDDQIEDIDPIDMNFKPESKTALYHSYESVDVDREPGNMNRHTADKKKRTFIATQLDKIEKDFNSLLYEGKHPNEIQKILNKKYPGDIVRKFMEASVQVELNKYSSLGFANLKDDEDVKSLVLTSKVQSITKSSAKEIVNKLAKLDFVSKEEIDEVSKKLEDQDPLKETLSFVFSLGKIRRARGRVDSKMTKLAVEDVNTLDVTINKENNDNKNSCRKILAKHEEILDLYKQMLRKGSSAIKIKIAIKKVYGRKAFNSFYEEYRDDIKKYAGFLQKENSQNFSYVSNVAVQPSTDANREVLPSVSASESIESKLTKIASFVAGLLNRGKSFSTICKSLTKVYGKELTTTFLLKYANIDKCYGPHKVAFDMLTNGKSLSEVKSEISKKFANKSFLLENEHLLQKHYGQLGYIFIDSNIYANCQSNEMQDAFNNLKHVGSSLISSVKSNSKCQGCSCNEKGRCNKVSLLISNNPIARSPRAAKKIFEKATNLVTKDYIEKFANEIKETGNLELISKFNLGLKQAIQDDSRNIGKIASKDRSTNIDAQIAMSQSNVSFDVELFRKENTSRIIDSILQ